jgi:hypothetical protein
MLLRSAHVPHTRRDPPTHSERQAMQLYAISEGFRSIMQRVDDAEGVLDESLEADLDAMVGSLADKVEACGVVLLEMDADDAALGEEIGRLMRRREAARKGRERLADYVARCLTVAGQRKVKGLRLTVSLRSSSSVKVDCDVSKLPPEFVRVKTPDPVYSADKIALKEALAAGRVVEGVSIETRDSLQVK